jgi:bisphosphoglycerate-independent phosphoglycerate mutase (AlkP superfamily)
MVITIVAGIEKMKIAQAQKAHHLLWFVKNGSESDFHQLSLVMCQV